MAGLHWSKAQGWDINSADHKRDARGDRGVSDGCHAEDDKYVELDYELAVALANATEGAARSTVLKVTQVESSHGFVAWESLVDGYAPKPKDPA